MTQKSKKTPPKNFMAPTISSKKRVLTEWNESSINIHHQKPSNLGKKSSFNELGVSKQPLTEISTLISPVLSTKLDGNVDNDVGFDVPYDPLTNYLSPRPKFLRYNPNRLRNRVIFYDTSGSSTGVSLDSSVGETCTGNEIEGDENDVDEMVVEDEEEVIEESKWGFKWEFFKCLMVFCVLVVSSMYITSMNLNGSFLVDHKYGNITSGVVPLFEIDQICVESDRIMGCNVDYEKDIVMSKASNLGYSINHGQKMNNSVVVESETSSLVGPNKGNSVNSQPKCQVEEVLAQVLFDGIEKNDVDLEAKSDDGSLEIGNDVVVESETPSPVGSNGGILVDSQQKCQVGEILAQVLFDGIKEKGVDLDMKSNDGSLEGVFVDASVIDNVDNEPKFEAESVGEEANSEIKLRTTQTQYNGVLVLILSMVTLVGSFLLKLYYKCNKSFSKATSAPKVEFRSREKKLSPMQIDVKIVSESAIDRVDRSSMHRCDLFSEKEEERMVMHEIIESEISASSHPQTSKGGSESMASLFSKKMAFNEVTSSHLQPSKGGSESTASCFSKEITSNENGKVEETMAKATPTPLRRSNRLRNRRVTSP